MSSTLFSAPQIEKISREFCMEVVRHGSSVTMKAWKAAALTLLISFGKSLQQGETAMLQLTLHLH